jgi:hypothetical protein
VLPPATPMINSEVRRSDPYARDPPTMLAEPLLELSVENGEEAGPSAAPVPALQRSASTAGGTKGAGKALRRLQRVVVSQLSRDRAERATEVPKPSLAQAQEHVRFFLPKNSSGDLLSLRCSEKEFAAHVGAGVALYMRFQKVTGCMFGAASLLVLPQLIANVAGGALQLPDPFRGCPGQPKSFIETLSGLGNSLTWFFFSSLLGNAAFEHSTHGWAHRLVESAACPLDDSARLLCWCLPGLRPLLRSPVRSLGI